MASKSEVQRKKLKKSKRTLALKKRCKKKTTKRRPTKRKEAQKSGLVSGSSDDLGRLLERWHAKYQQQREDRGLGRRDIPAAELVRRAELLSKKFKLESTRVDEEWIGSWRTRLGVRDEPEEARNAVDGNEVLSRLVNEDGYSYDEIYHGFCVEFNYRDVPDASLRSGESVWLLMASSLTGQHRTRILTIGKEWKPRCLQHVNMVSQPGVYAGGGVGTLTPDLLGWWLQKEFLPAALSLHPRAALVLCTDAPVQTRTPDDKLRLVVLRRRPSNKCLVSAELKLHYAMLMLNEIYLEPDGWLQEHLRRFSLRDAIPLLHRAWLTIRTETFLRNWTDTSPTLRTAEDQRLLVQLQWFAHNLGMEVTDKDVALWVSSDSANEAPSIKEEPEDTESPLPVPTAADAVENLKKALVWMESEPLDPSFLLTARNLLTLAKQASKMGLGATHPGTGLPFFCPNGEHLGQPPPAHMGIPPYQLDPKGEYWRGSGLSSSEWKRFGALVAASGLTRPAVYPFTTGQYPYPVLSPEMSQVAASWHSPSMYPISSGAPGFRSPYPSSLPIPSTSLPSEFYRFSPTGLITPHPGLSPHSHSAIITPGPKQELHHSDHNHRSSSLDHHKNSSSVNDGSKSQDSGHNNSNQDKKKPHIKKPLNAFMLYMKEMRAKVVAECTLKESAAINQILGRRWHALGREEQAKYYELARRERQLHMQLYPDWSSRSNTTRGKKRKRRQETNDGGNSMKKCRARYGLDQQSQWCKPCRRKKKCIRYMGCGEDGNQSEDNLGSCGSVGEAQTPPEDDTESFHHSASSPGGLSGLSSLTSPSMILPSPSASNTSPSVSLASPYMSLQSPLTPHTLEMMDCKPSVPCLPLLSNHHTGIQPPRNPVGTNPHDINNPLSVNQLTGKCIKLSSTTLKTEPSEVKKQ
ncbi:uncharacterized protein [Bemisia tabaci]|uniref:uncharacterized protein isoform X2 n=1 Tax=Bemisia tabaci TaxID=7038 RepID=UPI003B282067